MSCQHLWKLGLSNYASFYFKILIPESLLSLTTTVLYSLTPYSSCVAEMETSALPPGLCLATAGAGQALPSPGHRATQGVEVSWAPLAFVKKENYTLAAHLKIHIQDSRGLRTEDSHCQRHYRSWNAGSSLGHTFGSPPTSEGTGS